MTKKFTCPTCKSEVNETIINYYNVPMFQNLIIRNKCDSEANIICDINMAFCDTCGFVFNTSFDDQKLRYSQCYDNTQDNSPSFKTHIRDVLGFISSNVDLKGKTILEIGCGKGEFLKELSNNYDCVCYGFDPSYTGEESKNQERLNYTKSYFTLDYGIKADIIILRHVIEHLSNPLNMMEIIKLSLNKNGILYIETPDFNWIVKNNIIFDFTYEHCSYFNRNSLESLVSLVGMKVKSFELKFQDQYMCTLIVPKTENNELSLIKKRMIDFDENKNIKVKEIQNFIKNLNQVGNVGIWGAAGKGVMCCNLFDPEKKYIDCVIDINPNKQNGYIPITGHDIVSPKEILNRNIKAIIVVNSNYTKEISTMALQIEPSIKIFDIENLLK